MAKSENNIYEERVNLIETFVIRGMKFLEIKAALDKLNADPAFVNKFVVKDRQLRTYIKEAADNVKNSNEGKRKFFYKQSLKRYDDLYNKAVRIQDLKTAALINKERDRLLGLYDED